MTPDLLAAALGIHGILAPLSLTGLYRYSDRSTMFAKALSDTDDVLLRMRHQIAINIEEELAPIIRRAGSDPLVVSPTGYTERPVDAVASDAFREGIRRFLHSDAVVLVDYGRVYRARNRWCAWARTLSWTVLGLCIWEVVCVTMLALLGVVLEIHLSRLIVLSSFGPTALLILSFFSSHAGLLYEHDVIYDSKTRHPEF